MMPSLGRFMAVSLLVCLGVGSALAADLPAVRKDLKVEDLGTPVKSRSATMSAIVRAREGDAWHLVVALEAYSGMQNDPPFLIYDLDLENGEARIVEGVVGRPGPHSPYHHSNGRLYFGQSRPACLLEYDLATGKTRECGTQKGSYYFGIQSYAEDPQGRLYVGGWGRHLSRFDPKTGEFIEYGAMGSGEGYGYVYSLAVDDKYAYCGMGVYGKWFPVVLDTATGKWQEYMRPEDARTSAVAGVTAYTDGTVGFGRNYLFQDGKPVEVDPAVLRAKKPRPAYTDYRTCVELPQAAKVGYEVDLDEMQPTAWNGGEVIVRWRAVDPATGQAAPDTPWRECKTAGADVRPNCVKRLAPMPDGRFIGMSAFYGNIFTLDPATGESTLLGRAPHSVYDILVDGPMVFFGGYPTCFSVYDTRKPWTFSKKNDLRNPEQNPYVLQRGGKYNYQLALGADGFVYICGNHQRHDSGASLTWWDPEKPHTLTHLREGFEDHQPSDLIALDGGKFIVMGYGPQLVLFDTATHQVAKRIDLPENVGKAGKLMAVGADKVLSLLRTSEKDKDGNDVAVGRLALIHTADGTVEYVRTIPGRVFSGMTSVDLPSADSRFCVGPDGCGWLFIDTQLSRINPVDGSVEKIMPMKDRGRMFFVGDDLYIYNGGRQYFNSFADVLRIKAVFER